MQMFLLRKLQLFQAHTQNQDTSSSSSGGESYQAVESMSATQASAK